MAAPTNTPGSLQGYYAWTDNLKGVYYGPGCTTSALPKLLQTLGVKKALIVTGKSLKSKTDIIKKIESILTEHNAYGGVFAEIGEHAPVAGINNGMKAFRNAGADVIVSVGGGSPIDASKAILYRLQQASGAASPHLQIAIPTTLSAAEYTAGAGFKDESGTKVGHTSPQLVPAGIILDAELTLPTPERLWLSTGLRALDHAVENLYRPLVPLPAKVLCYAALADLFKYLPASKSDPSNVEVRQKLQLAAWVSLWPLSQDRVTAIGLSHALGHRLGATYNIPHGIKSCLTLAPVVALQAEVASAEDKACLAEALFYLRQPSTGSIDGDVLKLSSAISTLIEDLGLKSTLTEYKVPTENIPKIVEKVVPNQSDPKFAKVVKLLEGIY